MAINTYIKSVLRNIGSALRYEAVDTSIDDWVPTTVFKGLHIAEACTVTIKGVDEETIQLTLSPGVYPYGGIAIMKSGTSVTTGIVALF
jgi:hypothetical protein